MQDLLQQAITAIKSGNKQTGQRLLAEIIKADPRNENAWLWLSSIVDGDDRRRQCLQQVLTINPDNQMAKRGLEMLQQKAIEPLPKHKPIIQPQQTEMPKVETQPQPTEPTTKTTPTTQPRQATNLQWIDTSELSARLQSPKSIRSISPQKQKPTPLKPIISDRQLIQQYIAMRTKQGWQVISQTESSVQLRKPKRWSTGLLILGAILLIFFGVGLIFWLLALVDYVIKKEQIIFVTAKDLRAGSDQKPASAWGGPMILAGGIIGLFLLCIIFGLLPYIFLSGGSSPRANQADGGNKSTAQVSPTSTPLPSIAFADRDYPDIESLVNGVIGSRLKTSNFEFYSDSPGRKGYDVDVTITSPETRTRTEMLQIAYIVAHEFYYNFTDKQPNFLTLHLRSSEDTLDCVFGLGVGYHVASQYIPANPPDDFEKWFSDLVRSKNYGDLPGQSESSMAYGNDPTSKSYCNLKHWKK